MADSDWTDVTPTANDSDGWADVPQAQPSTVSAVSQPDKDGWADVPTTTADDRGFFTRLSDAYHGASQEGLEGIIARHALTLAGNDPAAVAQAQTALRDEYTQKQAADPWWNSQGSVASNLLDRGLPTLIGSALGNPENLIGGGGEGLAAKVGRQAALSGGIDVGTQFADMADNVQKDFDYARAAASAATGGAFAGLHDLGGKLFSYLKGAKGVPEDVAPVVEAGPHASQGPDVLDDGTTGVRGEGVSAGDYQQKLVDAFNAKDTQGNYVYDEAGMRKLAADMGADPDQFKGLAEGIKARDAGTKVGIAVPGSEAPVSTPTPTTPQEIADNAVVQANDAHEAATQAFQEAYDGLKGKKPGSPEYQQQIAELQSHQAAAAGTYQNLLDATEAAKTPVPNAQPTLTDARSQQEALTQAYPDGWQDVPAGPEPKAEDTAAGSDESMDFGSKGQQDVTVFSNKGLNEKLKAEGKTPNDQADIPNLPAVSDGGSGGKPPVEPPSSGVPALPEGPDEGPNYGTNTEGNESPQQKKARFNQENFDYNQGNTATEEEVRGAFNHFEQTLGKGVLGDEAVKNNSVNILKNNSIPDIIRAKPTTEEAGQGWTLAKRTAALAANNRAVESAKSFVADPSEANWQELNHWRVVAGAGVESVVKEGENVGRALRQFKLLAGQKGMAEAYRGLDEMMNKKTGPIDRGDLARLMIEHQNNPEATGDIALNSTKPYWEDYAMKLWYNFALSSPKTAVTTAFDNTQALVTDLLEHTLAPGVSKAETAARWAGVHQGIMDVLNYQDGWSMMKDAISSNGRRGPIAGQSQASADIQTAFDQGHPVTGAATHAPTGVDLGPLEFTSIGPKLVSAVDQTFRGIAANMELYGQAVRKAESLGLKSGTPEFSAKISSLRANPTKAMVEIVNQKARSSQYAENLPNVFGGALQKLTQRQANMTGTERAGRFAAFLLAPFPRVEGNIMRRILRSSPLGFLSSTNRAMWKEGGASRSLVMTRMALGSTAIGMMATLADQNLPVHFTGNGPDDYRLRQAMPPGWQPNSLFYHGKYYSMGNTLWATTASMVASARNSFDEGKIGPGDYGAHISKALGGMINSIEDNTWFKDGSEFFDMFKAGPDGDNARNRFVPNKVASFVVPAVVSQLNQSQIDPAVHNLKADTVGERTVKTIESRLPGVSKDLPVQHDLYGNAEAHNREFFTGTNVSAAGTDPTQNEMARLSQVAGKGLISAVRKKVLLYGKPVTLNGDQFEAYQAKAGQRTQELFSHFMNSPMYSRMTDEQRANVLKSQGSAAKQRALIETMGSRK